MSKDEHSLRFPMNRKNYAVSIKPALAGLIDTVSEPQRSSIFTQLRNRLALLLASLSVRRRVSCPAFASSVPRLL